LRSRRRGDGSAASLHNTAKPNNGTAELLCVSGPATEGGCATPSRWQVAAAAAEDKYPWDFGLSLMEGLDADLADGPDCGIPVDPRDFEDPPECTIMLMETTHLACLARADLPQVLHVASPNGQEICEGRYVQVAGVAPNGQPLWRQERGQHWLYSGTSGKWCIGGEDVRERCFACAAGYICRAEPHCGAMPDEARGTWARWDGARFVHDPAIRVSSPEDDPRSPRSWSPTCPERPALGAHLLGALDLFRV